MEYGVDRNEVLRYLGYAGQAMEPSLYDRIDGIIVRAERELSPKSVVRYFGIEVHDGRSEGDGCESDNGGGGAGDSVRRGGAGSDGGDAAHGGTTDNGPYVEVLGASLRFDGADIATHLQGAKECALMACTLGAKSEQELLRLNAANPLDALIYDAACSALIERVADATEARVVAEAAERGLHTNWRFSPGYGDLPLSVQPRFLAVLGAYEAIGLSATDTDLLLPTKSITAIVGLFDDAPVRKKPQACASCHLKDFCAIRAAGRVCHG